MDTPLPALPPHIDTKRYKTLIAVDFQPHPMVCSKREKVLVDEWVHTLNIEACRRAYTKAYGLSIDARTVQKWLQRPLVQKYVDEKINLEAKYNQYKGEDGKKLWLTRMLEYRDGTRTCDKRTLTCMEMIGKAMGYYDAENSGMHINAENVQFNFTQANGQS